MRDQSTLTIGLTVARLIELLKALPQDFPVAYPDDMLYRVVLDAGVFKVPLSGGKVEGVAYGEVVLVA